MSDFISLGEIMLHLSPSPYLKLEQASSLMASYGGAECCVTISLANFGIDCAFATKLPNNPLGKSAVRLLKSFGVNTENIIFGGNRIGIFFYELGTSIRPSKVFYDRLNSSIAEADISDFDFDNIFKNGKWFHITGITPALSDKSALLTEECLKKAKSNNLTVSMDLNYRSKLWSKEKAQLVMSKLMKYVDICIGNEEDAEMALGFKPKDSDILKGKIDIKGYKDIFKRIQEKFGFKFIATTLRESYSASDNGWSALVYNGTDFYESKKYDIHLVDRSGGGDSFAAGLIYSFMNNKSLAEATEFAVAASALKQTILGDYNLAGVNEVLSVIEGNISGRIQR
jgi:2-dehydro-3-deoxygluconokinase